MKRKLLALAMAAGWSWSAMAHTLLLVVNPNDDGSVTVEAAFSEGGNAAGLPVRLEDASGRVLWSGKLDEQGLATFAKPAGPYTIIVDGGRGHTVEEEGPP